MMAKSDFDAFSGSDFHEKPMDGTSTSTSIWQVARVPVNRKCLVASSYSTGSPVDFQTKSSRRRPQGSQKDLREAKDEPLARFAAREVR